MADLKSIVGPTRPRFLILTPVCVFLGIGVAIWEQGSVNPLHAVLALLGALAAHISVNALNEYFDFKSGLDLKTQRTPFSGGTGTLPANPAAARPALITGLATLAFTALVGIYFLFTGGWGLLPLGLLGLLTVYFYTNVLTRIPFLCLLAPGLGFGTFMVMGTAYVLTGHYSWTAFFASLVPFFLVSNLLLLNQFPDVEPDRSIGRSHYPIVGGRKTSARIYVAYLIAADLAIVLGVLLGIMPAFTLLGLLSIVIDIPIIRNVLVNYDDIPKLVPAMGLNVIINLLTPVLVAVGFLIGK